MPAKMSQAKPGMSVGDPDHVGDVGAFGVEGVAGGAVLEGRLVAGLLKDGCAAHLLGLLQSLCAPGAVGDWGWGYAHSFSRKLIFIFSFSTSS